MGSINLDVLDSIWKLKSLSVQEKHNTTLCSMLLQLLFFPFLKLSRSSRPYEFVYLLNAKCWLSTFVRFDSKFVICRARTHAYTLPSRVDLVFRVSHWHWLFLYNWAERKSFARHCDRARGKRKIFAAQRANWWNKYWSLLRYALLCPCTLYSLQFTVYRM